MKETLENTFNYSRINNEDDLFSINVAQNWQIVITINMNLFFQNKL